MKLFSKKKKTAKCPYCGYIFKEAPRVKIKCPECQNRIYIQKGKNKTELYTEKDHEELIILHYLESIGYSKKQYQKFKSDFENKSRESTDHKDALWALYGYLLKESAKKDDYNAMSIIYSLMATMQLDTPAEYLKLRKLSGEMELLSFKTDSKFDLEVEILTTKNSCDYCKKFSKRRYTLEKALEELPLPLLECDQGAECRCCYGINSKEKV